MLKRKPFAYRSLGELRRDIEDNGIDLPVSEDLSVFTRPITVCGHALKNRLCIQPLEGFDAFFDGTPSDLTFRRAARGFCGLSRAPSPKTAGQAAGSAA